MGKVRGGVTRWFPPRASCTSSGIFQRPVQHKQKEVLLVCVAVPWAAFPHKSWKPGGV